MITINIENKLLLFILNCLSCGKHSIVHKRLYTIGYGIKKLLYENKSVSTPLNRRIEIEVLDF
jgi:flagellar motor protein MotB